MNNTINGRTPEEIKKGLEVCVGENIVCDEECPYCSIVRYPRCRNAVERDALAYIQQLERERDAAVELLYDLATNERTFCDSCVYNSNPECCSEQKVINADCWEWRGFEVE